MDGPEKKNIQKNKIRFPSTYDGEFIKINSLVEGAHEKKTHGGGMSELVNIKCMYFIKPCAVWLHWDRKGGPPKV